MDYSLPGSSVHGIFQARVLGSGAIAFSAEVMLGQIKVNCSETSKVLWQLMQQGPYCSWITPHCLKSLDLETILFALSLLNFYLKTNEKFIFSPAL